METGPSPVSPLISQERREADDTVPDRALSSAEPVPVPVTDPGLPLPSGAAVPAGEPLPHAAARPVTGEGDAKRAHLATPVDLVTVAGFIWFSSRP